MRRRIRGRRCTILQETVRSVEVRRNRYHEELGAFRAETGTLTVNNLQAKKDNEALELEKHAARIRSPHLNDGKAADR